MSVLDLAVIVAYLLGMAGIGFYFSSVGCGGVSERMR